MTTVIQHYDVPHIPFSSTLSSPGKSGANQETEIDNRGNAHIAVNFRLSASVQFAIAAIYSPIHTPIQRNVMLRKQNMLCVA